VHTMGNKTLEIQMVDDKRLLLHDKNYLPRALAHICM
jgi:hypothetical protein